MSALFAIADLHLSLNGDKPMDRFGEAWVDHPAKIASAWERLVGDDDVVLLPGDLSWARTLREAQPDLAWIGARPGRKVLLKGNHDSWWQSVGKVRAALPAGCEALHHDSLALGRWVLVGARGWLDPDDPLATASDARLFERELRRLELSLADADRRFGREAPRLAMVHYPPWLVEREPTAVVGLLKEGGVRLCLYGHLHGDDHRLARTGVHDGIDFRFVAADAVGFAPVRIVEDLDR